MSQAQGNKTLETRLVYTVDSSKAAQELKRLQDQTKQVGGAAADARRQLDNLGKTGQSGVASFANKIPAAAVATSQQQAKRTAAQSLATQQTYALAPAQGASAANAYAQQVAAG